MNVNNVFYIKNIVDKYYPTEDVSVDTQTVVSFVKEDIKKLDDDSFSEMMISCFIPDLYSGMGKCEKLFTKLTELMVGEWWRRMGGSYKLPTKKSGTEDVELILDDSSVVCDAKVFRLGRSQKAPNVKDFLKLASIQMWIDNLSAKYKGKNHSVIGGLITYSSLHEWESDSEVYEECTNLNTPVIMLPYEILALMLKYKSQVNISDFMKIWDFKSNGVKKTRSKTQYWSYVTGYICKLLNINLAEYAREIDAFHKTIISSIELYKKIIQDSIDNTNRMILVEVKNINDVQSLQDYVVNAISERDNAQALDYLKHIEQFRSYKDKYES